MQASGWAGVANSFNFLVTWGLPVTVFHSTCIFCVYGMTLYWPTLQFYPCMYASFVCQYVAPPDECYYNTVLCCDYNVCVCLCVLVCWVLLFYVSMDPCGLMQINDWLIDWLFFIVECGITRFLYTMRVFEVRASSSPLGYLCAEFRFFRSLHCCASPWRKI